MHLCRPTLRRCQLRTPALLLAAGAALAPAAPARADDAIRTDRPDFVESSATVGRGRWQVETGVLVERDSVDSVESRTRTTPTLLRYGLTSNLELRVETDGATRVRTVEPATGTALRERGTADASLGVKWHMRDGDEKSGRPAIAWLLHVDVPSGSAPLRGRGARPSLRGVAEWELPYDFSLGVMPGLALDRDERGRFASGIFAVTVGKGLTERWGAFLEVAARQWATAAHGGKVITADAGTTFLVTDSIQLDLSVSRALTAASPDLAWGAGLSVRF